MVTTLPLTSNPSNPRTEAEAAFTRGKNLFFREQRYDEAALAFAIAVGYKGLLGRLVAARSRTRSSAGVAASMVNRCSAHSGGS